MEPSSLEEKYRKLAAEYSKIRAQASVLKRAVLDEQNKNSALRDTARSKESSLRRAEQEVDSLGFRNKQLEIRVASLQDDLNKDAKKSTKNNKTKTKVNNVDDAMLPNDTALFSEDLQKKIFENARLESLIADKIGELQLQTSRIEELESYVVKVTAEQADHDGKLRRELERLTTKNHDLEAKLAEASSIVGSDDTLYVSSECEQQQHTPNHTSGDERLKVLEKEVVYWRTQYELLKIGAKVQEQIGSGNCGDVKRIESTGVGDAKRTGTVDVTKVNGSGGGGGDSEEQILYRHFTQKIEDLFLQKCMAESKLAIYTDECIALQRHLENLTLELKAQEEKFKEKQRDLRIADEDMATIRINYEEQIAVLTEQVINLSDQLAALK